MRLSLMALCLLSGSITAADFVKDVQPIFVKACVSCHGSEKQKGGLRLDRKADALKGGDNGVVFVAKDAAKSPLIHRVTATDDTMMPPSGEKLTAGEVATLRAWIDAGAVWPDDGSTTANPRDWWSLRPLVKPAVPASVNPIDHFIRAKLAEKGLKPSPEADRRTLIRRVYFDLTGLPPTFEEVEAFVRDDSPKAYESLVDRLLASPRYGERWARHWLDVVHYGETHGYDKDQPRPNAWPYRDYVIRAFNNDTPYAQFVQEQVAGDVLFPGDANAITALGFLSAGPWDLIGHAEVPETKIDGKIARHLDRDDFVANTIGTFQSLTAHCAQCHNHKFDPISQEDYYALQAVFAAIDRADKSYDADPAVAAKRLTLEKQQKTAMANITKLEASGGAAVAELDRRLAEGKRSTGGSKQPEYGYHSAIEMKQDSVKWVQVDLGARVDLTRITLRACDDDFNNIGAGFGFPVRFKMEVSEDAEFKQPVVIVDRTTMDQSNPGTAPISFAINGKAGRYIRVTATKLAPRQPNDFILAIAELEVFDAAGKNVALGKTVTSLDSIEAPTRWRKANLTDGIAPSGPKVSADELAKLTKQRDEALMKALGADGVRKLAEAKAELEAADAGLKRLGPPSQRAYIATVHTGSGNFTGTGGKPRDIHILSRGDVTKPGKLVQPGAISAMSLPFEVKANAPEGERRAALAKWLTSAENPLTWRSLVNRVWQYHLGRGLVDTSNDFGKMGQLPTHPELLDWLAVEIRDGGGSLKKLHKLIVMSETYRQVSTSDVEMAKQDANNQYLWRQNRRKLEAEAVRDSILMAAGKLDLTMGGPSFRDFVVEKPEHSPHYEYHLHDPEDPKSHRRAVYRFTVRSKPEPFLAAFDCADPSLAVEKRNQTLTPQQALALLNNKLTLTMAKHFATRVEKLATDPRGQVTTAFRLALGREPKTTEADELTKYATDHGMANACRVILNLNEFVFVD